MSLKNILLCQAYLNRCSDMSWMHHNISSDFSYRRNGGALTGVFDNTNVRISVEYDDCARFGDLGVPCFLFEIKVHAPEPIVIHSRTPARDGLMYAHVQFCDRVFGETDYPQETVNILRRALHMLVAPDAATYYKAATSVALSLTYNAVERIQPHIVLHQAAALLSCKETPLYSLEGMFFNDDHVFRVACSYYTFADILAASEIPADRKMSLALRATSANSPIIIRAGTVSAVNAYAPMTTFVIHKDIPEGEIYVSTASETTKFTLVKETA